MTKFFKFLLETALGALLIMYQAFAIVLVCKWLPFLGGIASFDPAFGFMSCVLIANASAAAHSHHKLAEVSAVLKLGMAALGVTLSLGVAWIVSVL
jgi:hypothetical protein